ncbi:DUF814 domain-containing protein [Clostridium malenominatum]|uniref:DUF814 domain-containing protein n=1 Tax=Clostridium malenominatum TaxID=1539 RepID=A0ABN1J472_9CLOT
MTRALAMISGGLDSILAAKLIKEQGIEVIGICFKSYFFNEESAKKMAKQIDIPLKVVDFSKEHFQIVREPKFGYGKNMNPCIDCHSLMMNYSGKLLEELEAEFIITGEVLNQRPMSQNRSALDIVKKHSGFSDKILRPLCAKNLLPTAMELNGLVNREELLDIAGRGRKVQMELAEKWGIKEYPSPAGGCKLTEPNYSKRLKELLDHVTEPTYRDLELLRYGRHFRISPNAKIISTRTKEEGEEITKYLDEKDLVFSVSNFNGSTIIVIGNPKAEDIEFAAKVAGRYSKGREKDILKVNYGYFNREKDNFIESVPATEEEINKFIVQ